MKFSQIKQLPQSNYRTQVPFNDLLYSLDRYKKIYNLDLNPEYQRCHVWTEVQQIEYVEHRLMGGNAGQEITLNCPGWQGNSDPGQMTLVDGKQRIEAVTRFLNNEIKVFGYYFKDFEDRMDPGLGFYFNIAKLEGDDILELYLSLNAGIAHTEQELDRVRGLMSLNK